MKNKVNCIVVFILLFLYFPYEQLYCGISTSGTSSLVNIPVAKVLRGKNVVFGVSYIHQNVAYLANGRYSNLPFYICLGYLPRVEISAGVVFVPGKKSYDGTSVYKDGVLSIQFLALKESDYFPAIAFGVRDIYSYILLNTSYIAFSKTILKKTNTNIIFHCGYGSDIMDKHVSVPPSDRKYPVGHTIIGTFGGIEMTWKDIINYMVEYDSDKINTGIRIKLSPWLAIESSLMNMSSLSGGIQFTFLL